MLILNIFPYLCAIAVILVFSQKSDLKKYIFSSNKEKTECIKRYILGVHSKFQLNRTIIAPVTAYQRK